MYRVGGQLAGGGDHRDRYVDTFAEAKNQVIADLRGEITETFRLMHEFIEDVATSEGNEDLIGNADSELDNAKGKIEDIAFALFSAQEWEESNPQEVTENRAWDRNKTSTSESWAVEVYDLGRYWIVAETLTEED